MTESNKLEEISQLDSFTKNQIRNYESMNEFELISKNKKF